MSAGHESKASQRWKPGLALGNSFKQVKPPANEQYWPLLAKHLEHIGLTACP